MTIVILSEVPIAQRIGIDETKQDDSHFIRSPDSNVYRD